MNTAGPGRPNAPEEIDDSYEAIGRLTASFGFAPSGGSSGLGTDMAPIRMKTHSRKPSAGATNFMSDPGSPATIDRTTTSKYGPTAGTRNYTAGATKLTKPGRGVRSVPVDGENNILPDARSKASIDSSSWIASPEDSLSLKTRRRFFIDDSAEHTPNPGEPELTSGFYDSLLFTPVGISLQLIATLLPSIAA